MKPVYQQPMDGQCVRASICTIFDFPIELGPRVQCDGHTWDPEQKQFICTLPEHRRVSRWTDNDGKPRENVSYECSSAYQQEEWIREWAAKYGLRYVEVRMNTYGGRVGPSESRALPTGLCIASGGSPRFAGKHAVVWDTRLTDFEHPYGRMIHDPAPVPEGTRPGILQVDSLHYFEVEDPSLLHKLATLKENP